MTDDRFEKQLRFIVEIDKMKNIFRKTLIIDGTRRENDAEHSWHIAVMAILLSEYCKDKSVDVMRAVKMALVHDLIEIYAGDTFAYDEAGNSTKEERERDAADRLYALLPQEQGAELRALWEEFDAEITPDARYAAAMDHLQPFIHNYMTDGHTWREGKVTAAQVCKRMEIVRTETPELWGFVERVIEEYTKNGCIIAE
ncbi:MAG: HD domain-containing protein [Oscillospiraceae bacterium]